MKNERINYTQVVWEITRLLQDAESLEEALRTSLGEVVKAVGAEAGQVLRSAWINSKYYYDYSGS